MTDLPSIQRGATFGFYARRGVFSSPWAFEQVERIKRTNIDHVVLVVTVMQETFGSVRHFQDFENTPSDLEVLKLIEAFHEAGITVQLRPMQQTCDGGGRLCIWFPNDMTMIPGIPRTYRQRWFDSFAKRTEHYAALAQHAGCAMYGLDSELDRMVEEQDGWRKVLAAARAHFDGHITNCHTFHADYPRFLADKNHWWYELDSLSCSYYPTLDVSDDPTVDELVAAMQPHKERIAGLAQTYGKPFYFGEAGCTACEGAARHPASWSGAGAYAGQVQANYVEALLRTFWNESWWRGLYWWKWDEQNERPHFTDDQGRDLGFTIRGKPLQDSMRSWFSKPDRKTST